MVITTLSSREFNQKPSEVKTAATSGLIMKTIIRISVSKSWRRKSPY